MQCQVPGSRKANPERLRKCPNCNVLIFFESESHDEHIKRALKAAHKLRRALAQTEQVKPSPKEAPKYNRTS
jgi:hypothetical protein